MAAVASAKDGYVLSNKIVIPCIGLGTWQTDGQTTIKAVTKAIQAGYRLIDTAAAYGNETFVGQGIKESGIDREELFITSKLRNAAHGYRATLEAFQWTLDKLGLEYLDLYLMHWSNPIQFRGIWVEAMIDTWKAFEELYRAGKIRAIGVSNFLPRHLDILMEHASIKPMVDQLKLCPGVTQPDAVCYCRKEGIITEAYSPFGTGQIFRNEELLRIAEKYNKTVSQVVLRWCISQNFIPLPKSANEERITQNLDLFDFSLDEEDAAIISSLDCGQTAPDPDQTLF